MPLRWNSFSIGTLGINLDGNYDTAEAGVIAVGEEYFASASPIEQLLRMSRQNPGEPLLKITPSDDAEKMAHLNYELMNTINRIIRRELKTIGIKADVLLRYDFGLNKALIAEMRFAASSVQVIRDMRSYGANFIYTETPDNTAAGKFPLTYRKMKLGYAYDLYERPEEAGTKELQTAELIFHLGLPVLTR